MKIGIEAQRIFRKQKHGMDRVAIELIKNLQEIDKKNEYYVFVKPDEDNKVIQSNANFTIVEIQGNPYPIWEQFLLPRAVKKYGCQLLHCTSNTAPLYIKIPLILTLHDTIFMENSFVKTCKKSGTIYQKSGNLYRKYVVPQLIKNTYKIITVSKYQRTQILLKLNIKNKNLVTVIYNGVNNHYKKKKEIQESQKVKEKYNLPDRYFFFMGSKDPRKNTKNVLKGFAGFIKKEKIKYQLVMLHYSRKELIKTLKNLKLEKIIENIVLIDFIDEADLPSVYRLSSVFLYPSLKEGFGIPILEAMACETPVITSNISSMPEISGNAAHLITPENYQEITAGLLRITNFTSYRHKLIRKGLQRSILFSWRTMAKEVLDIYQDTGKKLPVMLHKKSKEISIVPHK